jgi:hypothetical protein
MPKSEQHLSFKNEMERDSVWGNRQPATDFSGLLEGIDSLSEVAIYSYTDNLKSKPKKSGIVQKLFKKMKHKSQAK